MMHPHFAAPKSHLSRLAKELSAGEDEDGTHPILRALGLASVVIGVTALGLYIGREMRQRYKFKRRTPYDFYSKAGDPVALTEYGMGV